MKKKLLVIISLVALLSAQPLFAETIILKSGQKVEGKITEKTDKYISIDIEGIPSPYFYEDILSIDGSSIINQQIATTPLPKEPITDITSKGTLTEQIQAILKHLGYPEATWPAIEKELTILLDKIDFPKIKEEASQAKADPEQLKNFFSKLRGLIDQEGYRNPQFPHPLIKLLINSLGTEDILNVIESSPISQQEKEESKQNIVACSAISQLNAILLELLEINTKAVFATGHVFNCVPLDDRRIIFVDLSTTVIDIVDLDQFYRIEGKYWVLNEECRLNPDEVRELRKQWQKGVLPDSPKKVLNLFYYYIYVTDDYSLTPVIYGNSGYAYYKQGNLTQAIFDYNKAIEICPNLILAYNNRGLAYYDQDNFTQAISDYNKAIEINPNYALPYYGRGLVYYLTKEYNRAWSDVHKAEELGYAINPEFLMSLKLASGRDN